MTYTITLADGTAIEDLSLNGNNFISNKKLTESSFTDLSRVTITDEDGKSEERDNMELVQIVKSGKEYWFVLRELSPQEIRDAKIQADIEYLAMMADVEI